MIQKLKKSNAGFTLVELIVVIAILGVLATVLVPQYISYVNKAKAGSDIAQLGEVLHVAEVYAATQSGTQTFTMTLVAGKMTIPTALVSYVGASELMLKSSQGLLLSPSTLVITYNATTGQYGWDDAVTAAAQNTETYFSTIAAAD